MKKKPFEIQRWMWICGIPTLLGVVLLFSRTVVTFADMPKRVDTIEQYIQAQQRANEVQAEANRLMSEQLKQQKLYCEVYEGATWCFDEKSRQWYQQGGQ